MKKNKERTRGRGGRFVCLFMCVYNFLREHIQAQPTDINVFCVGVDLLFILS